MAGGRRTKIRVGVHPTDGAFIEQVNYESDMMRQFLCGADIELLKVGRDIVVKVAIDGTPITHSPFTGGKFDITTTQVARNGLDIDNVRLFVPGEEGDDAGVAEKEEEEEEDAPAADDDGDDDDVQEEEEYDDEGEEEEDEEDEEDADEEGEEDEDEDEDDGDDDEEDEEDEDDEEEDVSFAKGDAVLVDDGENEAWEGTYKGTDKKGNFLITDENGDEYAVDPEAVYQLEEEEEADEDDEDYEYEEDDEEGEDLEDDEDYEYEEDDEDEDE